MTENSKVIIVSGGSRGLGQAAIESLLQDGHHVATFSRTTSTFIQSSLEWDPSGSVFYWKQFDALEFHHLRAFAQDVICKWGKIDALVNNAGMGVDGLLTLTQESEVHSAIALNIEAVIHLTRACLKNMIARQSGAIINISSVSAIRGYSGLSTYSATKAALDGLTRSLAREVGPMGIRVNSLVPGYFESEMVKLLSTKAKEQIVRRTPLRRLGTAKDLAGVLRFLLSPEAYFITGQTIVVDGGMTC